VPEPSYFFCERCGAHTALGRRASKAHYCPSCRLFTCESCWTDAAVRCNRCLAGPRKTTGLTAARPLFTALSAVQGELASIANREQARGDPAEELAVERYLLATKATSIAAAIELALGRVQPRHAAIARSLRGRARAEMASITDAIRPVTSHRLTRPDPSAQLRRALLAVQTVRARVTKRAFVIPATALITGALGMAAVLALRPAVEPPTAVAPTASPTREGQVAGGSPKTVSFTFDELTAYGPPGPGWELLGGVGHAEIAPFPDPFDRSLRVSSGRTGTAVICRTGLPDTDRVSIDLSADDWRGMSLEVRQGREVVTITVDDGRRLVLEADGMTNEVTKRFDPTGWQRLILSLDLVDGVIGFDMEPRGGDAGLSSGIALPSAWLATTGQTTGVCFSSPRDRVDGIYLDNLIISAGAGESG
jgi:hypothetical protein